MAEGGGGSSVDVADSSPAFQQRPRVVDDSIYNTTQHFFSNFDTDRVVYKLFEKHKQLKRRFDAFELPSTDEMCITETTDGSDWKIDALIALKARLNQTKSKLDHLVLFTWHLHTKAMNPAGNVMSFVKSRFDPEYASQAWCKFYETLNAYQVIPMTVIDKYHQLLHQANNNNGRSVQPLLNSVHLCEAPGAFISALNHYLHTNYPRIPWGWKSTSLSPYWEGNSTVEMINDDILIQSSFDKWTFLADGTGNIISRYNIEHLIQQARKELGEIQLITADGSVDCQQDPCEQEKIVVHLHFAEIVTALHLLHLGGSFILKIFTFVEAPTVSHLYLLSCLFAELHLFKPGTSKEGNSEVYVVCLNYLGATPEVLQRLLGHVDSTQQALFSLECIPEQFKRRLVESASFFVETQINVIVKNVQTYTEEKIMYHRLMYEVKNSVSRNWLRCFPVSTLPASGRLFKNFQTNWIDNVDAREKKMLTHADEIGRETSLLATPELILAQVETDLVPFQEYLQQRHLYRQHQVGETSMTIKRKNNSVPFDTQLLGLSRLLPAHFVYNKPYQNIKSSRFCSSRLLGLRNKMRQIIATPALKQMMNKQPKSICKSCTNMTRLAADVQSTLRLHSVCIDCVFTCVKTTHEGSSKKEPSTVIVHCFHQSLTDFLNESDTEFNHEKLQILLNLLFSVGRSVSVFLCRYPLLTRLNIGILFCLILLFEHVFITSDGIFLHKFKGFLMTEEEALRSAGDGGQDVSKRELFMDSEPRWKLLRKELAISPSTWISKNKVLSECLPIQRLLTTNYSNLIYTYNISLVVESIEEYVKQFQIALDLPEENRASSSQGQGQHGKTRARPSQDQVQQPRKRSRQPAYFGRRRN